MTATEAKILNRLLGVSRQWSRGAEARTDDGTPVTYDNRLAASWSLDGALFLVMGPKRAMEQMVTFTAHMLGQSTQRFLVAQTQNRVGMLDPPTTALSVLKDYNDLVANFMHIRLRLHDLPVGTER